MDHPPAYFHFLYIKPYILAANAQVVTILGVLLLLLLIISFFVSSAKIAFFSLSYRDINMLKTKQHPSARRIITLLDQPRRLLTSLQISNVFINIGAIIVGNVLLDEFLSDAGSQVTVFIIKLLLLMFLLVLFSEMLPKMWATQNNIRAAYSASLLAEVLDAFFGSISRSVVKFTDGIERSFGGIKQHHVYKAEDIDQAIEMNTSADATEEEKNILRGIIRFGHVTVKQIMRTRLDVSAISYDTRFPDLVKKIQDLQYSRLPVYKGSLDDIVGIIHSKDVLPYLEQGNEFDWHTLVRPPFFVPEQNLIKDLLRELQRKSIHFAVVVDEFGGTEGIVTMEDIMEEIVGDIRDEFDDEESVNRKLDDRTYVFEGRIIITDACKAMGLPPDTFDQVRGESESIAGLVLELAGEIPKENQEISIGDFTFTVLEIDKNRIKKVKITVKPPPELA
ncbi:MAG: gliding motility-associated protein GldE [Chitinophagaceae bacterium]|nr:gliding motility-associated protein GldE [Chitinophagaceae bacterium]MCW5928700.1 gliding motility-associated protein GldE [Chitinophagaceae bacterium]